MMEKKEIVFLFVWVISVVSIIASFHFAEENARLKGDLINCKMYNSCKMREVLKNGTVMGLAYGNDYFCVWAKDRHITEVLDTCAHEWAHTYYGLLDKKVD